MPLLVVSAIAAGLNDAFLLTISFHDPSLSSIIGSSKSLIPYIKDNIERSVFVSTENSGMEIALDLANFGTKASIVARTRCTLLVIYECYNLEPWFRLDISRKFLAHSLARPTTTKDDSVEKLAPSRSFRIVLGTRENRESITWCTIIFLKIMNLNSNIFPRGCRFCPVHLDHNSVIFPPRMIGMIEFLMNVHHIVLSSCRTRATPFSIYKDSVATSETDPHHQTDSTFGAHLELELTKRKENNAIPDK
ncbi:hypothetical protein ACSQ67_016224 [Phaseolus vulgaris]